uniref:WG repeat-containing protein n=1 Tax=Thaumasiovibrio occultus TaxID=1891184 RepID=UPI000B3646F1|nr:WG repeat-containing protein [Thaumasiovibrio occultus]
MRILLSALLLFVSPVVFSAKYQSCMYRAENPHPYRVEELALLESCLIVDNGAIAVNPRHLERMRFDDHGLASFFYDGGTYYVNQDGKTIRSLYLSFNFGPDDFWEDIARSETDDKIGYFNRDLDPIVEPKYDWGSIFQNGVAVVCIGCERVPSCDDSFFLAGGKWGLINRQGVEIVPPIYDRDAIGF